MKVRKEAWFALVTLTVAVAMLAAGAPVVRAGAASPAAMLQADEVEITGKVQSVDAEKGTFRVSGTDKEIVTTAATKFSAGLSLAAMRNGQDVKVVGKNTNDGKIEALEVSSAKPTSSEAGIQ
jgi:hypothetical protein